MSYKLINNNLVLTKNALIAISQRACNFGDGIFETCKIIDGIIYNYEAHQARIIRGLKLLQFDADIKNLYKNCYILIKKNKIKNGIIRIMISRGDGSAGYLPLDCKSLIVIETLAERKIVESKITVGISKIRLSSREKFFQQCKTMQAIPYILNKISAQKNSYFDNIMLSDEGNIGECSSANIFFTKNGEILTPSLKCNILNGTIRQKILTKFKNIKQVEVKKEFILKADEIFLTNASFLVLPIDELIIGDKKIIFKKEVSSKIYQYLKQDIKNYVLGQKEKIKMD